MRVIDKFVEELSIHKGDSFSFSMDKKYYSFMQSKVGNAVYVYGIDDYEEEFEYRINNKPELVAIISNDTIYVVNEFFLNVWGYGSDTILPSNVELFDRYRNQQNKYVKNEVFQEFYSALDVENVEYLTTTNKCKEKARSCLLSKYKDIPAIELSDMFSELDIAKSLCEVFSIYDEAMKIFEDKKDKWIAVKSERAAIRVLMEEKSVVEDWELKMVDGLKSVVDAKQVTVEFTFKDKKTSIKIAVGTVYRKIENKDYFSGYDFGNKKRGDEMIKSLGAATWKHDGEVLTCKHITKIAYGKKVLYGGCNE